MPSNNGGQPDWIQRLLDESPALAFNTFLSQRDLSPGIQRFMQGQFGQVNANYEADLGRQLAAGTIPTTSFSQDYLPNKFNLQDYLGKFSPETKGLGTGGFNSRTQWGF